MALHAPSLLRAPATPPVDARRPALRAPAFRAPPSPRARAAAAPITMRFGGGGVASKSKQAYICRDCGYIYNDRTPFDKLPDNYFCPVCGAPKRRFRSYEPAVAKNANATDVRKARKEQLKKEESMGQALPIGIAVGIIALVGIYLYLNSIY